MHQRFVLIGSAFAGWTVLTLLDSAAKAAVLFALAALVVFFMKRASAASRHLVWVFTFTAALLLPLTFKFVPQWRVLPSWMKWEDVPRLLSAEGPVALVFSTSDEAPAEPLMESTSSDAAPVRYIAPAKPERRDPPVVPTRVPAVWIIGGWGMITSLMLLPLFVSVLSLRRKALLAETVISGPLIEALDRVKSELGMKRKIRLLIGSRESMPMVWGIFRCHLLLPEGADEWSLHRLRVVLLHEVSHLRRNDPLALLLAHLALACHWFNPLAWYAMRQLRVEQENACDDSVLRHGVLASDYAIEVLDVSSSLGSGKFERVVALTMARPAGLESRITGILDASRNRCSMTRRVVWSCSAVAAMAVIPVAMLCAGEASKTVRGRILDRGGIVLAESGEGDTRSYPVGVAASHRVGYVSKKKNSLDLKGIAGAESTHDELLAAGKDVRLTMDTGIQGAVHAILSDAGVIKGAVVVLDCNNGDLLANVSMPTFDPNEFVPVIPPQTFKVLRNDPASPLLDRSVVSTPPGSTFKLVTALAAARSGHADQNLECKGYDVYGNARLGCWIWTRDKKGHGNQDLHDGMVNSCNCYFGQLANLTGIESLKKTGNLLGLGAVSGCGYPNESAGIFPGSEAAEKIDGLKYSPLELANVAIGQGASLATPMQLAVLAAAVGNGRYVWIPRLSLDAPPHFRTDLLEEGWKPADLALLGSAMRDAVMSDGGVVGAARSEVVGIAGLSGTAMTARRGRPSRTAWFVGYAPADNPRYAIAVMVEEGLSGGQVCGPIAKSIFETICAESR